ncbi:phytoene desaturase family protein [Haloechinothrix sp. LS1_15]|uniref:phytoene desaturase family protein n=1 Tax=Haloechinothrix sp. LS1_15 TaxID=2652248 RepID=UPI002946248F|nr:phytoene desaturase family protein [Haloechinothrix sp. LS1_15]MDV6012659.1 phytoene desaturase [Haloechinothrix sp. LS1_15]
MRTVDGPTDHVVVVGAGLSGLSAALHLLGSGRHVTVLEREDLPGGRAASTRLGDFTVDTGASVLTMPGILDEAFAAVGTSLADHVRLSRLDPAYRARFADGSQLAVRTDAGAMEEEIRSAAGPRDARGYRELRRWLGELYRVQADRFIGTNFDSPTDLLSPEFVRLVLLGGFGRLGPRIARYFHDERVRRLFSFQALYAGLAPRSALAAYGVIAYMDTVGGVYYPHGGMGEVARAMADAAAAAGADVRFGTEVTGLDWVDGRVRAVHTGSEERIGCDAAVLSVELTTAYGLLRGRPHRPSRLRPSPSAVVLHAGCHDAPGGLDGHHTIFFGHNWDGTFTEIIRDGSLMSDPSLLVSRPTVTDPTLAPPGKDVVSILAPAPNLDVGRRLAWDRVGPAYREELLATLGARGVSGLPQVIEMSVLRTPRDWAAQGFVAGTPFSLAHTLRQTGPFRPGNLVRGARNVVLAGCGTVPGVGIPPVVISGKLAAERVTGRGG